MSEQTAALDQAIAWHLRLPDLAGDEWDAFVAWLEQSPGHRAAYDAIADADAAAAAALAAPVQSAARPPRARALHRARIGGWGARATRWPGRGAAAAAIVAGLVLAAGWSLWPADPGLTIERTRPGTTKQFAFPDGTSIALNGDSALALDEAAPRAVRLDRGEARFRVTHAAQPFTVEAGGFVLRDLGTVFNVQLTDRALVLDVSEGRVLFDPGGANLVVAAGEQVRVDRARNLVIKGSSGPAGDWLDGAFVFDNAPLAEAVAAVHRRYGTQVVLSAGLSARTFTGNVRLSGNEAEDVPHLARLIGAQHRREGATWVISGGPR